MQLSPMQTGSTQAGPGQAGPKRLAIRHETLYSYSAPLVYAIQQLRLTPRLEPHQSIVSWDMACNGERHAFVDAYDNESHMLTINGRHDHIRIEVAGTVEMQPLFLGRLENGGALSPLVFNVPTRLTQADPTIAAFAATHLDPQADSNDLLALAAAIRAGVVYESGITTVRSSAAEALQLGAGVCQDHAHLFIACCHAQGIPARYVSGYIDPGTAEHGASHAWVDAWISQPDFQGWVSVDVTHGYFASASHCRLAIGRDYESAAPIKGARRGGGEELLKVAVHVAPIKSEAEAPAAGVPASAPKDSAPTFQNQQQNGANQA